jgi:hypothetical protein
MPELNFALVKKSVRKDRLTSDIESIDRQFQSTIETELLAARNSDGALDTALFGEALTALHKMISDICELYEQITFKNMPEHIVSLLQEMINSNSMNTSRLRYVYFSTEQLDMETSIPWEPEFTGTGTFADLPHDEDDDDFEIVEDDQQKPTVVVDDFILVAGGSPNNANINQSLQSAASAAPVTDTHHAPVAELVLERNLSSVSTDSMSGSITTLSSSLSTLATSSELEKLQKQLADKEEELKSSTEQLSSSMLEYKRLHDEATTAQVTKLLAKKLLERTILKTRGPVTVPLKAEDREVINKQRVNPQTYDSFVTLTTIFNNRINKDNDVRALAKKQAALQKERTELQAQVMSMSCSSFFGDKAKGAAIHAADMNQSTLLPSVSSQRRVQP